MKSKLLNDFEKWTKKEWGKPPKVRVMPIQQTKDEIKKAKMMQELINYAYKTNANGINTKFWNEMKRRADELTKEALYGIRTNWDSVEKASKHIIGGKE